MAIAIIENVGGRPRVAWRGAALLLVTMTCAFAVAPAISLWAAFADGKLASTTAAVGCGLAVLSFGAVLGRGLRVPVEKPPTRA